jgi:hypothetical protein
MQEDFDECPEIMHYVGTRCPPCGSVTGFAGKVPTYRNPWTGKIPTQGERFGGCLLLIVFFLFLAMMGGAHPP